MRPLVVAKESPGGSVSSCSRAIPPPEPAPVPPPALSRPPERCSQDGKGEEWAVGCGKALRACEAKKKEGSYGTV